MKKYVAPIIVILLVTAGVILIALFYVGIIDILKISIVFKIIIIVIMVAIIGALITVLYQRMREIKTEDEDDFSKY